RRPAAVTTLTGPLPAIGRQSSRACRVVYEKSSIVSKADCEVAGLAGRTEVLEAPTGVTVPAAPPVRAAAGPAARQMPTIKAASDI
ncbi:MAG: hypothetical protein J7M21_00695, partial [Planctomycetes bacterium]|nr:hypothetical protein [Planctomycetota bacterium]